MSRYLLQHESRERRENKVPTMCARKKKRQRREKQSESLRENTALEAVDSNRFCRKEDKCDDINSS